MAAEPGSLELSIEKKVLTLQTMMEYSLALNSATTLKQVYDIIMRTCMGHKGIEVTALMLGNYPPSREFTLKSVRGADNRLVNRVIHFSEAVIKHLYEERKIAEYKYFSNEAPDTGETLNLLECHIIVPVFQQDMLIGMLSCSRKVSAQPYSREDIEFLQLINSHAGIAINNIMTMNSLMENNIKLEKKLYDLKAVEDISDAVSATLDLEEVCHTLVLTVMGHLAAESGSFYLSDTAKAGHFKRITSSGDVTADLEQVIDLPSPVLDQIRSRPFVEKSPDLTQELSDLMQSTESAVCFRVGSETQITGLCFFGSKATGLPYKSTELELASLLVTQVVFPIRNSLYYQQICENNVTLNDANLKLTKEIAERKKAERELIRFRELLRNIIDSIPSILVGVKNDGSIMQWNSEAERITGIPFKDAKGRTLSALFPWLAGERENILQAIVSQAPLKKEKVLMVKNGEPRYWDIDVSPLIREKGKGAVIRIDDVTERVRIEEVLIQTEKIVSVGGLAAGMAHEINNPLAGIIQNIQVMRNRIQAGLPKNAAVATECGTDISAVEAYMNRRGVMTMLDYVMASGRRAAKIVSNMLSFSRKSDNKDFFMTDLRKLMDETVELSASDYDLKKKYDFRNIRIDREYDPALPKVPCDPSKIQQVFLNILKNGAQSMIERNADSAPPRLILRLKKEKNQVRAEIEDNGCGMTEEIRRRIFEPFFTTKEKGAGTGLGLSVSYFIIAENHNGTMTVESVPGKGSNFIIHLPMEAAPPKRT